MKCPDYDFYLRDTDVVAKDLIGKKLVRILNTIYGETIKLSGIINETEAYGSFDDHASHAHHGLTPRNAVMFGKVGMSYVYLIYGMHHCFNVTAHTCSSPAGAVLVRSLIPNEGTNIMLERCKKINIINLTNGPGKISTALNIQRSENGIDMTNENSNLRIEYGINPVSIITSQRIGISKAKQKQWRFHMEDKDPKYLNMT